jgi:hypothetical protein
MKKTFPILAAAAPMPFLVPRCHPATELFILLRH